ncbi:cAMP-regulated phosphoprotein 21 [Clarias magur]|uniref:cAMP-regulated phosphoprotein 21 n=1 Tax=Clarias magur TaxID=1594786 RepID=A0A8J4UC27_CLAMG|nr:cAMP-regulated phosphoprotein 21 [Clarias magur]
MVKTSACVPPEPPQDLRRRCGHPSSVNHPEGSMNEPPGKIERRLAGQNGERRKRDGRGKGE